ncbi:hypothetical protein SAY87_021277 [Trapa incisa]|uniref:DNA-directed DNA polymerase n=1 Tax=Trapa incisa TaxID=236973 RepID=A0AAN7PR16_9MYRT|nr:hypothetical protein SAY87_021277 [Trapa incisa]
MAMGVSSTTTIQGPLLGQRGPSSFFIFPRSRFCRPRFVRSSSSRSLLVSAEVLHRGEASRKGNPEHRPFPFASFTDPPQYRRQPFSPVSGETYVNNEYGHSTFRNRWNSSFISQVSFNSRTPAVAPSALSSLEENMMKWRMAAEYNRRYKDNTLGSAKIRMHLDNLHVGIRNIETTNVGVSSDYKPNGIGLPHTQGNHVETLREFDQLDKFNSPSGLKLDVEKIAHLELSDAKNAVDSVIDVDQMQIKNQPGTGVVEKTEAAQSGSSGHSNKYSCISTAGTKNSSLSKQLPSRLQNNDQTLMSTDTTNSQLVKHAQVTSEGTPVIDVERKQIRGRQGTWVVEKTEPAQSDSSGHGRKYSSISSGGTKNSSPRKQVPVRLQNAQTLMSINTTCSQLVRHAQVTSKETPVIDVEQMQIKSGQGTVVGEKPEPTESGSDDCIGKFSSINSGGTENSFLKKQVYCRLQSAETQMSMDTACSQLVKHANVTSEETAGELFERSVTSFSVEKLVESSVLGSKLVEDEAAGGSGIDISKDSNTSLRKNLMNVYNEVIVVDNISTAREIVQKLTHQYKHLVHACDTEVANIDVKQETPVDHGEVICFSIYSGPCADYGNGKSCIWVDILDGGGKDLLQAFAPFFEDPNIKKVWHNYSFDNHVIENYGVKLSGFHADTMHMTRLWNSSRRTDGGYSLEALTADREVMGSAPQGPEAELMGKVSMKTIFGKKKVKKDGLEGKIITLHPVEELQRKERKLWISYSSLDAISTLKLYESLRNKLVAMAWRFDGKLCPGKSMFDFYKEYWQPFGDILIRMEREGMLVDRSYLADIEKLAKAEQEVAVNRFRNWASKYCPDAKYMNVGSDTQLRQLLFGGILNIKDGNVSLPEEKTFRIPNVDGFIEEGKITALKYRNITLRSIGAKFPTEIYTATGWPSVGGDALKILAGKVSAVYDFIDEAPKEKWLGQGNEQSISESNMEEIASKNADISQYGTAFQAFPGDEAAGKAACHSIAALYEVCSIDSLISNFILPLQGSVISGKDGRIHCSLNINTETGRLSARRPNLQNQPALEKDRYKIRQAFIAAPGNSLIVADYGQLELRILAHLANCKSMLEAFEAGGDFHSRTALNMYDYIRKAVEKEEVILEWHGQPGEDKQPVPLLKDAFASERRKAKMLNFSIAYGKTPMGLARDWKVSVEEARKTVHLWYKERQEVRIWQEKQKEEAREHGQVYTLLGRARRFPSLSRASYGLKGHIERAAINTPVQGSAADVATCAMLQIFKNERLKELGWKLLLQVHDEVILEGPSESAEEAKAIVVNCMSKPFFDGKNILRVELAVDANYAQNWYAAK